MSQILYIFGISKHANLIAHYFGQKENTEVSGFVVDDNYYSSNNYQNLPVSPYSHFLQYVNPSNTAIFSALGYSSIRNRKATFERLSAAGFTQPTYIHPTAFIDPTAIVGKNCILMPGVIIERNVIIDDNVTIWSNVTVCHDTHIKSHCFIAANTVIGGYCKIGSASFLGFSSTVLQHTILQEETLLGAMSLIRKCESSHGKYIGIPAQRVSEHKNSGICVND